MLGKCPKCDGQLEKCSCSNCVASSCKYCDYHEPLVELRGSESNPNWFTNFFKKLGTRKRWIITKSVKNNYYTDYYYYQANGEFVSYSVNKARRFRTREDAQEIVDHMPEWNNSTYHVVRIK